MGEDMDIAIGIAGVLVVLAIFAIHHWISGWRYRRARKRLLSRQRQQHQKG